jgi:hypothetical protein
MKKKLLLLFVVFFVSFHLTQSKSVIIKPNMSEYSPRILRGSYTSPCDFAHYDSVLNANDKNNISENDGTYVVQYKAASGYYTYFIYNYTLPVYKSINFMYFFWDGKSGNNGYYLNLTIYNFTNAKWILLNSTSTSSTVDTTNSYNKTNNFNDLVSNNKISICTNMHDTPQSTDQNYVIFSYEPYLPQFSNIKVPNNMYQPKRSYQFNVTVTVETVSISKVFIEFNDTTGDIKNLKNFTMSSSGSEFYYTFNDLPAGNYSYKFFSNTSENDWNYTAGYTFSIEKAKPELAINNGTFTVNTSKLSSYWRMEEASSLKDYSGNNNIGYLQGGISCGTNGYFDKSCYFDKTNDYILVYDSPSLNITGEITVEMWIYPLEKTGQYVPLCKGYQSSYSGYEVRIDGGFVGWRINPTSSSYDYVWTDNDIIDVNKWQQIVVSFNGSTQIYKNGRLVKVNTSQYTLKPNIQAITIGAYPTPTYYFSGYIDEIRIWNRSLTPDEIKELYETKTSFPNSIKVEGYCPPQIQCKLFRNKTDVTSENATFVQLGAGYYYYIFNTSGNSNYTESSILIPFNITRANTYLTMLLNGTEGNRNYNSGSSMNITVTSTPDMPIPIYLQTNITNWSLFSEENPLEKITERIKRNGVYNITAYVLENENYTGYSVTYYANFSGNVTSCLNGCFMVKNTQSKNVFVVDKNGNVDLKGLIALGSAVGKSMKIKNSSNEVVAWVNATGYMNVSGAISQDNGVFCSPSDKSFTIKDNAGNCVFYIDKLGNMWSKGIIVENSDIS